MFYFFNLITIILTTVLILGCAAESKYKGGSGNFKNYESMSSYRDKNIKYNDKYSQNRKSDFSSNLVGGDSSGSSTGSNYNNSNNNSSYNRNNKITSQDSDYQPPVDGKGNFTPTKSLLGGMRDSPAIQRATMKPYTIRGVTYRPHPVKIGDTFDGIASWYGPDFHARATSNGETYNMHAHTAAHKTLPMNTIVKVYNKDNGKITVVRINDRGPFVAGRIIDLSNVAARDIEMVGKGIANVRIEVIGFGGDLANNTAPKEQKQENDKNAMNKESNKTKSSQNTQDHNAQPASQQPNQTQYQENSNAAISAESSKSRDSKNIAETSKQDIEDAIDEVIEETLDENPKYKEPVVQSSKTDSQNTESSKELAQEPKYQESSSTATNIENTESSKEPSKQDLKQAIEEILKEKMQQEQNKESQKEYDKDELKATIKEALKEIMEEKGQNKEQMPKQAERKKEQPEQIKQEREMPQKIDNTQSIEDIDNALQKIKNATNELKNKESKQEQQEQKRNEIKQEQAQPTQEYSNDKEVKGNYMISLNVFSQEQRAISFSNQSQDLIKDTPYKVGIIKTDNGLYRVAIRGFKDEKEARDFRQNKSINGHIVKE